MWSAIKWSWPSHKENTSKMLIKSSVLARAESLCKNLDFKMGPFLRNQRFRRYGHLCGLLLSEADLHTKKTQVRCWLIALCSLVLNPCAKILHFQQHPFWETKDWGDIAFCVLLSFCLTLIFREKWNCILKIWNCKMVSRNCKKFMEL